MRPRARRAHRGSQRAALRSPRGRASTRPSAPAAPSTPPIGNAIAALGYDADLDEVRARPPAPPPALGPVAGYPHVQLNPRRAHRPHPAGCPSRPRLDRQGAGGRPGRGPHRRRIGAGVAREPGRRRRGGRRAPAGRLGRRHRPGVVDARRRGRPGRGDHAGAASPARPPRSGRGRRETVTSTTSSTRAPATASSPYWVLVSATGASCVEANLVTTAAIVWGADALDQLAALRAVGAPRPLPTGRSSPSTAGPWSERHELDRALVRHPGQRPDGAHPAHARPWCWASPPPPGPGPGTGPVSPSRRCTAGSP